ncbi:MAG: alpha-mannosidase [Oscillospiraceae bacterium]|nr:alpha-mannosidase [Oscillospiraceae bacterium]
MKQKVHLICNAHLDPVWQWEWEEGAAAAVSTFRAAADFCEETDDFIFCHNEVTLYRWVEEYEPSLFQRIQALVKAGKWHIMGGWYLQPDCNMPSGESIIRQMQLGKEYFKEKFDSEPKVAVNFDPFGHSRGLVQIMTKAGYTGYLFMRPVQMELPANNFKWVGFDGSEILAHRLDTNYNSPLGGARAKAEKWLEDHKDLELGLIPWGVGNHGGGPSRKDIADLNALKAELKDVEMIHSTPETYFEDMAKLDLPKVDIALRPWAIGCYTSQVRIKQMHRKLEDMLAVTEKMCSHAVMRGLMEYPTEDLKEAARDLCFAEFHDVIPGSSIQPVEDMGIRQMDHALEILSRLRARAFFALAADEKKAAEGEIPVLAYNPHPYEAEGDYYVEFMLADQNWEDEFTMPRVYDEDGNEIPSQVEKEDSNLTLDWRKRVVFHTKLKPFSVARFNCRMEILPKKPVPTCREEGDFYVFENETLKVRISKTTGLMDSYIADGTEYLAGGAANPWLFFDSEDPWEMQVNSIPNKDEAFRLMTPEETARFCGIHQPTLPGVHVIEDGAVRTVIEAALRCRDSYIVLQYALPKKGNQVELRVRVLFAEKDKMLKLCFPTVCKTSYVGQTMFGTEELPQGEEAVAQRWVASVADGKAFTVINNGIYGSSFEDGEIRMSLLRSAGYTAHPINDPHTGALRDLLPQDRFSPRIDQGERLYVFRLEGGCAETRLASVGKEAALLGEAPMVLSFFPNKEKKIPHFPMCTLTGDSVEMTAFRRAQDGNGWIIRLFESAGRKEKAVLSFPGTGLAYGALLHPFEAKTLRYIPEEHSIKEDNILA